MLSAEPQIKETFIKSGQLKLVFGPVLSHADLSSQTHQAAECAAEQNQFWHMHDALFERQDSLWGGDIRLKMKELAADLGLDSAAFNACLDEQRQLGRIQAQDDYRRSRGIRGQPTFEINGSYLVGAQPFDVYASVINDALNAQ